MTLLWDGFSVPVRVLKNGGAIVDGSALTEAREAVDLLKEVRGVLTPDQRHILITGALAFSGDSDYDDLEAFGAFIVRMNIALCIAVGPQARPIFASVGREGSWDGESQHVIEPSDVYDELGKDIRPGDVFVVLGGVTKDMDVVVSALTESLA
jgi:UDP-N-acetylmuramyl pentapeptide synthase